ncbi:holin [Streptomyces misionensis]|uniref:holin n=1 Tax=Streptomyces misionensis TaxID=67331 RepID=UPI0036B2748F
MAQSKQIETKVKAASVAAFLGSTGLLAMLAAVQDNARLLSPLPDAVSPFVLALIPTLVTFVSGWAAKHTPRI